MSRGEARGCASRTADSQRAAACYTHRHNNHARTTRRGHPQAHACHRASHDRLPGVGDHHALLQSLLRLFSRLRSHPRLHERRVDPLRFRVPLRGGGGVCQRSGGAVPRGGTAAALRAGGLPGHMAVPAVLPAPSRADPAGAPGFLLGRAQRAPGGAGVFLLPHPDVRGGALPAAERPGRLLCRPGPDTRGHDRQSPGRLREHPVELDPRARASSVFRHSASRERPWARWAGPRSSSRSSP